MTFPVNLWSALPGAERREFPSSDPEHLEIFGYCDRLSYVPGEAVGLCVHTTAAAFDVTVTHESGEGEVLYRREQVPGLRQSTPPDAYATGCHWRPALSVAVSAAWPSGVFLIHLTARDAAGRAVESEASFVVRPSASSGHGRLLMILTTGTYVAYNDWGGANAYRSVVDGRATDIPSPRLSLDRPWARGFLKLPDGAPRHGDTPDLPPHAAPALPFCEWAIANGYSLHYPDSGWSYYEKPFVAWARAQGYEIDFIAQHDLTDHADTLERYSAAVIVGHDEYWTWEMRDAIDGFVSRGGNLARFAGNFLWQVRMEDNARTQVCYKSGADDPIGAAGRPERATTHWDSKLVGRPAAATMGLTGMGGVYVRFGAASPRAPGGYTVYRPEHWALAGSDLRYGDMFGKEPSRILAFEVDSVAYTFRGGLPFPTFEDGAPSSLEIIAMAPAARGELPCGDALLNAPLGMVEELIRRDPPFYSVPNVERGAAMMATFSSGAGSVFNSGCCNWVAGLIHRDPFVERITANVLDRFLSRR